MAPARIRRASSSVLLCAAVLLAALPTPVRGQTTAAPRGLDYILHRPRSAHAMRTTRAPWAPFVTPRNVSCAGACTPGPCATLRRADDEDAVARMLRAAKHAREDTVVLFYGARWCPWSRAFWPVWSAVAARFHALCLLALDAHTHPSLNAKYGVYGFPTVLHFRAGKDGERYTGDRSADDFLAWVVNVTRTAPAQPDGIPADFFEDPWANGLPEDVSTDWVLVASSAVTILAAAWAAYSLWHLYHVKAPDPGNNSAEERMNAGEFAEQVIREVDTNVPDPGNGWPGLNEDEFQDVNGTGPHAHET